MKKNFREPKYREIDSQDSQYLERLKYVVEATNVGTWEWNLVDGQVQTNYRFAEIIGRDTDQWTVFPLAEWEDLIHPDDRERHLRNREEYLSGSREAFDVKYRVRHGKGHWVWIHDMGRIMKWDDSGRPQAMFGSLNDITEQKETEIMLEHSEKLGALERLARGIAHDMNNQLMKIRGTAEMAVLWDNTNHYRASMETIWQISDSAAWVIHQLQHFTGDHEFDPVQHDLAVMVDDLVEVLNHTFEKEITIKKNISDAPLYITADSSLLNRAFFNICYNAKEAMDKGGILAVEAGIFEPERRFTTYTGDLPAGRYGTVVFRDDGEGIDQKEIDKIFEPFFTTKKNGALGLGLAKVVSAVIKHNGGIQVKSSAEEGTEFTLFFPLEEESMTETPLVEDGPKEDVRKGEILIIDDEEMICDLLADYFTLENRQVACYTDPRKGIEYFAESMERVGLVLLDMLMPDLSGRQVLDELITINPRVRVIFLSGYTDGLDKNEANSVNIAGFMAKPVRLDELKKAVEREL